MYEIAIYSLDVVILIGLSVLAQFEQNLIYGDSQGQLYCLKASKTYAPSRNQHEGAVRSICYNVHGELVFSGSEDRTGLQQTYVAIGISNEY